MNFEIIETERLILKGLSPADMKYIFEQHSKPEIKRILGHHSEEDYQKEESKYRNGYASYNRSFLLFLLTDKASDTIIGRCGLHNWNAEHRRAEIGYVMEDERYKKKGLMAEALGAVIKYGFTKMNLHRIEALVGTGNVPSLRLMEKNNFIREGLLREHYFIDDKYEDSALFSKLHKEYIAECKEK
jgi:ribosomal-protein-alanine N-acetyltransferase